MPEGEVEVGKLLMILCVVLVGCVRLPSKFHRIEVELSIVARKRATPGVQYCRLNE
jgi:hypothetical protein